MEGVLFLSFAMEVMPLEDVEEFTEEHFESVVAVVEQTQAKEIMLREYGMRVLPACVGRMTSLVLLDLAFNKLSRLPDELGKLVALRELYLDHNSLEELPETMGSLLCLELLHIQQNRLTCVPESLCDLPKLRFVKALLNRFDFTPRIAQEPEAEFQSLQEFCLSKLSRSGRSSLIPVTVAGMHPARACPVCHQVFFGRAMRVQKRRVLGTTAQVSCWGTVCSKECWQREVCTDKDQFSQLQCLAPSELARATVSLNNSNNWMAAMLNRNQQVQEPQMNARKSSILVIPPGSGFNAHPNRMEFLAEKFIVHFPDLPEPPAQSDSEGVAEAIEMCKPYLRIVSLVIAGSRGSRFVAELLKDGLIQCPVLLLAPSCMKVFEEKGPPITAVAGVCDKSVPIHVVRQRAANRAILVEMENDGHSLESLDTKSVFVEIIEKAINR